MVGAERNAVEFASEYQAGVIGRHRGRACCHGVLPDWSTRGTGTNAEDMKPIERRSFQVSGVNPVRASMSSLVSATAPDHRVDAFLLFLRKLFAAPVGCGPVGPISQPNSGSEALSMMPRCPPCSRGRNLRDRSRVARPAASYSCEWRRRRDLLQGRRILLIISGGIAAYKSLELIRRLRDRGAAVRCVMTEAAAQFVTPLSVASLSEDKVYDDLFSLTDESEMGHIRLSREADLLVVAPASADLIARMAAGLPDDLATTALLASDKPVLIAPTMNLMMWEHPATQANLAILDARGVRDRGPQ